MASTYTTNLGIEKIGTGEQSGTWGDTTNTNFDILDEAVNGIISITLSSAGSSGSPNSLPITDGASSNGRNKFIEFVDGGDLGGTAYVQLTPNDAEKIVHIRNSLSSSRSIIVFQGTYNASNDFEIVNGADVLLKFNGGGSGATVTDVNVDLTVTGLTAASAALTTADINGGTADNVTIGGSTAAVGTFTTANATTVDTTNIEVTNIKAKDGTSAGSIADSTGVVTVASAVLTTADINGGTADNVTIGGSTAAAGTFTTFTSTGIDDNASSTAITITSGNDLGVGVTSPRTGYRVDIQEASDNGVNIQAGNASADIALAVGSASTADKFVIEAGGDVGIGTSSPGGILHLKSDDNGVIFQSSSSSNSRAQIFFQNTGGTTTGKIAVDPDGGNANVMAFSTGSSERMRIDSSGNVGIGITSIEKELEVQLASTTTTTLGQKGGLQFRSASTTVGNGGELTWASGSGNAERWCAISGHIRSNGSDGSTGDLVFGTKGTKTDTSPTEAMRIDKDGNVGIGATSLSNKLTVNGNQVMLASGEIKFADAGNSLVSVIKNGGSSGTSQMQFLIGSTPAEVMRLTSSGSLIVGATSAGNGKVTSVSSIAFEARSSTKPYYQWYNSGAGTDLKYWRCGNNTDGSLDWQTVNDAYSSSSTKMTLDSNGDLGVGTTNPTSKLHVSGTSGAGSRVHIQSTGAGLSSFDGSGPGLLMTAGGMNTTNKFTPAIQFGTTDETLTTTNPKVGAAINGVASQAYSTDSTGGMELAFYTTPINPGTGQTTTERMRLNDDGILLVGKTAVGLATIGVEVAGTGRVRITRNNGVCTEFNRENGSGKIVTFSKDNTEVGSISVTSSATSYATSSDVRLKENIVDAPAGSLDDIQVRSFDWKADGSHQKHGLVAQELVEVAPEAVHQGETDDEMWSVDYSKLVPMMIKEIQDLKAEIAALKGA